MFSFEMHNISMTLDSIIKFKNYGLSFDLNVSRDGTFSTWSGSMWWVLQQAGGRFVYVDHSLFVATKMQRSP